MVNKIVNFIHCQKWQIISVLSEIYALQNVVLAQKSISAMNLMNITVGSNLPPTQMFTELRHAYLPHPKDICVGGCMGHGPPMNLSI